MWGARTAMRGCAGCILHRTPGPRATLEQGPFFLTVSLLCLSPILTETACQILPLLLFSMICWQKIGTRPVKQESRASFSACSGKCMISLASTQPEAHQIWPSLEFLPQHFVSTAMSGSSLFFRWVSLPWSHPRPWIGLHGNVLFPNDSQPTFT